MKKGFYNPQRAKEEEKIKEVIKTENEKRDIYFERIKRDKNFQKYIVEDILRANIESLTDTRLLMTEKLSKEDLADKVLANIKASQTLINILNKLL